MEAILELLFTLLVESVNAIEFKNLKTRPRVLTVIFALLFGILSGSAVWGAVALFRQGSTAGTVILGCFCLAFTVVGLIITVRGHKTGWKKY